MWWFFWWTRKNTRIINNEPVENSETNIEEKLIKPTNTLEKVILYKEKFEKCRLNYEKCIEEKRKLKSQNKIHRQNSNINLSPKISQEFKEMSIHSSTHDNQNNISIQVRKSVVISELAPILERCQQIIEKQVSQFIGVNCSFNISQSINSYRM